VNNRDVAARAAAALVRDEHVGCAFDVTGPAAFTYSELEDRMSRLLGRTIRMLELTPDAARARMIENGMPSWHADVLADFATCFAGGGGARVTDVVLRLTGRTPRSVGEFLDEHAGAFGPTQ